MNSDNYTLVLLTDILESLVDGFLSHHGIGEQKSVFLKSSHQRRGDSHLLLVAQIIPRGMLRVVQQIATGDDHLVQQLGHQRLPLALVRERLNILVDFLRHFLDDLGRRHQIAAVQHLVDRDLRIKSFVKPTLC